MTTDANRTGVMPDPGTWMTPLPICKCMRKLTFSWNHLTRVLFGTSMALGQMWWYIVITTASAPLHENHNILLALYTWISTC
jgi:hypothetical protein